ncbi:MAG: type II toxin-antitoxin system RelE family toxin [Limisphaerales bacterium]
MSGAPTQIASREFDGDFLRMPLAIQANVQRRIDAMGLRLDTFPHYRMSGSDKFRLRVGDFRVIYRFDLARREIYLIAIGHRREIYRR